MKDHAGHPRQDDQPKRIEGGEAERAGGARLCRGHGAQAAAKGLREIAGIVEGDADKEREETV